METELGFMDASSIEIQRVHRLGKKKGNEPKPILARFLRYKDCEKILSLGRRLKDSNYKMYKDLPYEIVQRRKQLRKPRQIKSPQLSARLNQINFLLEVSCGLKKKPRNPIM